MRCEICHGPVIPSPPKCAGCKKVLCTSCSNYVGKDCVEYCADCKQKLPEPKPKPKPKPQTQVQTQVQAQVKPQAQGQPQGQGQPQTQGQTGSKEKWVIKEYTPSAPASAGGKSSAVLDSLAVEPFVGFKEEAARSNPGKHIVVIGLNHIQVLVSLQGQCEMVGSGYNRWVFTSEIEKTGLHKAEWAVALNISTSFDYINWFIHQGLIDCDNSLLWVSTFGLVVITNYLIHRLGYYPNLFGLTNPIEEPEVPETFQTYKVRYVTLVKVLLAAPGHTAEISQLDGLLTEKDANWKLKWGVQTAEEYCSLARDDSVVAIEGTRCRLLPEHTHNPR